jgi:hypothetical protein
MDAAVETLPGVGVEARGALTLDDRIEKFVPSSTRAERRSQYGNSSATRRAWRATGTHPGGLAVKSEKR